MLADKYSNMLTKFQRYYSNLHNQAVDWWPSGRACITVKLQDGTLIEFDSMVNTIRTIHPSSNVKDVETLRRDIGFNIKKMLQSRGIPQGDVAKSCGVTEAMLSRYIHGTSLPSLDKVNALASALGCRVIDIIGETYDEYNT